jgi:hypothetical protein
MKVSGYYDLEELTNIVTTTRRKYDIPIIAQLTASNTNYLVVDTFFNECIDLIFSVILNGGQRQFLLL